ncbi:hypothetical protein WICMUC_005322 [Wickerhamomyces mucosus]|uniref:TrmE-type G domain-containing protein n=1 Tax=Wickerhamomyces mucosus TaxID=1378264 RepID=A0A9P8T6W9_9ASCO|nr:hypothetical protein WICMUC_005322 [Wickerhamomyces mucosus]
MIVIPKGLITRLWSRSFSTRIPINSSINPLTVNNNNTSHLPTIYALSTHFARSAIGIVRISGKDSSYILSELTQNVNLPKARMANVRKLYEPNTENLLDESLVIYFPGPKTYTGEDLVELHLHGGKAVITSVLKSIKSLHDPKFRQIRYAEAGEFSKRSFQNGRFDLTEIESIRELIDSETEFSRKAAINGVIGGNKLIFENWRNELKTSVGLLTAIIDFAEDAEIEDIIEIHERVNSKLFKLQKNIDEFLTKNSNTKKLLNGIKMVLLGSPNVGKSSILNQISNDEISIVSDIAGTTRDIINIPLDIGGYKVIISDTAGIRNVSKNKDSIEIEGIKRAKIKAFDSDLVMVVISCDELKDNSIELNKEFIEMIKKLQDKGKELVIILNKIDLIDNKSMQFEIINSISSILNVEQDEIIAISCLQNINISKLTTQLINKLSKITQSTNNEQDLINPILITSRVEEILENDVIFGIDEYLAMNKSIDDVVLATESLNYAINGIGKITGENISIDEVLGVVFENFCVGK